MFKKAIELAQKEWNILITPSQELEDAFLKNIEIQKYANGDQAYYLLEEMFIVPAFNKSEFAKKCSASFIGLKSRAAAIRWARSVVEELKLIFKIGSQYDIKVNTTNNKLGESRYRPIKRTISLHQSLVDAAINGCADQDYHAKNFAYTLIHEFSHALSDLWFCSGGHDYQFHYCLLKVLSVFADINPNKIYRSTKTSERSRIERRDFDYINCFESHRIYEGVLSRATANDIRHFEVASYESAIALIEHRYNLKLNIKTCRVYPDGNRNTHIEVPYFDYYEQVRDSIQVNIDAKDKPVPDLKIHVIRTTTGVRIICEKQRRLLFDKPILLTLEKTLRQMRDV